MASLNNIGGLHYEMMRRCYNKNSVAYKDYGAKGISVCEEWHDRESFRKWAIENGYIKGLRLERIDSKKGYDPSNCRFGFSRPLYISDDHNPKNKLQSLPQNPDTVFHLYHRDKRLLLFLTQSDIGCMCEEVPPPLCRYNSYS